MALIGLFAHMPKYGDFDLEYSVKPMKQIQKFVIKTLFSKKLFFDEFRKAGCSVKNQIPKRCGYQLETINLYEKLFNAKEDYKTRYYYQMISRKLVQLLRSDETYLAVLCYGNPYVSNYQNERFKRRLIYVFYEIKSCSMWEPSHDLDEFLSFVQEFNKQPDMFYDLIFDNE